MKEKNNSVRLQPRDTILLSKKPASVPILIFGILSFLFISAVATSYIYMYSESVMQNFSIVVGSIFVILSLHFSLLAMRTRYILTNERIFIRYGGIRPSTVSVHKSQISDISVEKSMIESMTGTGRIRVHTSTGNVTLSSIPCAKRMAIEISKHIPKSDVSVDLESRPQTSGTSWISIENFSRR